MSYNSRYFPISIGENHEKNDRIGLHYGIRKTRILLRHKKRNSAIMAQLNMYNCVIYKELHCVTY